MLAVFKKYDKSVVHMCAVTYSITTYSVRRTHILLYIAIFTTYAICWYVNLHSITSMFYHTLVIYIYIYIYIYIIFIIKLKMNTKKVLFVSYTFELITYICTLYTVCILYTMYNVHCTLYSVNCTLYIVYRTLYTMYIYIYIYIYIYTYWLLEERRVSAKVRCTELQYHVM